MSKATKIRKIRLFNFAVFVLLVSWIGSEPVLAQGDPGQNVNIIGLTLDENDIPDKFYRQQNEPSCAVRPGDSACIICAYNDYRTLDVFGDAWQGVSQSCDAGNSWLSRIAPGSPADIVAPLPAAFAADPRLQAIPGMAIFNFIAGYRDSNEGVLAIQHWLEVNKEDADHYEPGKVTYIADEGTSGRFIDKPDMVAVLDPPSSQGTLSLTTDMENEALGSITRDYPTGTLYVAYAVFTGSNSVKVLLNKSFDWGRTFKNQALKLSEDQNQVSGITLTAIGDKVLAVWRRVGDNNNSDAIMYSVISNSGKKATKGAVLAEVCAFDQPTIGVADNPDFPLIAFRTNDFPWSANDGANFYAFYSDRRAPDGSCDANGRPRIVAHYSENGGLRWSDPIQISPEEVDNDVHADSFQFMPTAFGANGKIQVAWYDTRREAAELETLLINKQLPYVADHVDIDLTSAAFVQRKVDVYTTSMTIDQAKSGTIPDAVRVSQYSIAVGEDGPDLDAEPDAFESEASFANKKLFGQGKLSFLGDYIALAARQFRKNDSGVWESNADLAGGDEDFFAAWTDNRDVRGEVSAIETPLDYQQQGTATPFAKASGDTPAEDSTTDSLLAKSLPGPETGPPRDKTKTAEGIDGTGDNVLVCTPGEEATLDRARDANIYGSLIKDRVRLYAPTPSKPLGGLQRAFVMSLANAEDEPRTYDLMIAADSCNDTSVCRASFRQMPSTPDGSPYDLIGMDPEGEVHNDRIERITIPANSTLARTVFVVGAVAQPVVVQAFETLTSGDGTVTPTLNVVSTVALGDDSVIFDPDVCTDASCSVQNAELHNLTLGNLTLGNLDLANQELLNLTLGNLTLGNLTLGNLTLGNLTLGNLTLGNLTLGNLTLGNLTLGNAALANPSLIDQAVNDPDSGLSLDSSYRELLEWAIDPANGVDPALLNPALLGLTIDDPDELLNLTLGNLTLGNLTLGNLTLGNLTLGNLTLGNPSEPNLTLGNLTLGNLTLGNAAIADPVLNEATCPAGTDCTVSGLSYEDYTYPITNKGNVRTAIDADITVEGDVAATQLIAWTANVTPTSVNCENILQMEERVQAVVNNPDTSLDIANIDQPFRGEISTVAGPGETVFFSLRVFGTQEQLRNVSVSGFTASSQAANCIRTIDPVTGVEEVNCSNQLNEGIEQILADMSPPVITLNGESPMFVNVGDSYSEPGATAVDAVDGAVTVSIGGDTVNTSILATYEVIYSAQDVAGNSAQVSRWVTIEDREAPVITLNAGSNTVDEDTPYADPGATATDNVDGQFAATATAIDTSEPGSYTITYTATDSSGNAATSITRTVTVTDTTVPVITVGGTNPDTVNEDTGLYSGLNNASASDNFDASVSVTVSGWTGDTSEPGVYTILYDAVDAAGNNAVQESRQVTVTDTTVPVIAVVGANPFLLEAGTAAWVDVDPGVTATDNFSTATVTIAYRDVAGASIAGVNSNVVDDYLVDYTATDAAGNWVTVTRTVTVQDTSTPDIIISDPPDFSPEGPFVLPPGQTTFAISWPVSAQDLENGLTISCNVIPSGDAIPSSTNYDTTTGMLTATFTYDFSVGTTSVECSVTDQGGNSSLPSGFDVIVEDVPTISAINTPFIVTTDDDGGLTATVFESELIDNLLVADLIDTVEELTVACPIGVAGYAEFGIGSHDITCSVTDSFGNSAETTFTLDIQYRYTLNLAPIKNNVRSGSVVPLDWYYTDPNNNDALVDSSAFSVAAHWTGKFPSRDCTGVSDGLGDGSAAIDAGSSDFRYSNSSETWQYSWQTPSSTSGSYWLSIEPSGGTATQVCVYLR